MKPDGVFLPPRHRNLKSSGLRRLTFLVFFSPSLAVSRGGWAGGGGPWWPTASMLCSARFTSTNPACSADPSWCSLTPLVWCNLSHMFVVQG